MVLRKLRENHTTQQRNKRVETRQKRQTLHMPTMQQGNIHQLQARPNTDSTSNTNSPVKTRLTLRNAMPSLRQHLDKHLRQRTKEVLEIPLQNHTHQGDR